MADFLWRQAVNHRPFVQPVAAEKRRPVAYRHEQIAQPGDEFAPLRGQRIRVDHHSLGCFAVFGPAQKLACAAAREHDARPWMPAAQPGGTKRVIIEKKIMNRMFLAARGPRLVRIGPNAHARLMFALAGAPLGLGENFDGFGCDHGYRKKHIRAQQSTARSRRLRHLRFK